MGCPSTKQAPIQNKSTESNLQLIVLTKKLQWEFSRSQQQFVDQIKPLVQRLKRQINKPPLTRSKINETNQIQQIVRKIHLGMIYQFLVVQCKYILDRQAMISVLNSKDIANQQHKKIISEPIEIILFSISIISDGKISLINADLIKFQQLTVKRYKQIRQPKKVQNDLLNYYKSNPIPHPQMIKEYVFCFCQEENVSLSKFGEVGHNFKY